MTTCRHIKGTLQLAKMKGPAYLRLAREPTASITSENNKFQLGKADILAEGYDIVIIFAGTIGAEVARAVSLLHKKNIYPTVINMHTIKPIDKEIIIKYAKKFGEIITIEEHLKARGLGSAISEVLVDHCPARMKMFAIYDRFGESGQPDVLLDAFGLSGEKISRRVERFLLEK